MEKHHNNITILRKFVDDNDLQDNHSNIVFDCEYKIKTEKNFDVKSIQAMITFDNFNSEGELLVLRPSIDTNLFPTIFKAKYNDFSIVDNSLIISDRHPNPNIGAWEAKITV